MIEISNFTEQKIDKDFFEKIVKNILKEEKKEDFYISISFVGSEDIRKVNKKYRRKDKPTDVLSFNWENENKFGEILICPSEADDLKEVLVHGVLHLLGYTHEEMKKNNKSKYV